MNILVYGAGAIGSYLGGALALAGESVSFIARPAQAAALNERGLTIHNMPAADGSAATHVASHVRAYTSPAEALAHGPYDCLILALKSFDTEAAIADLKATGRPVPPIVCAQNGVDNEPRLRETFGAGNVIAGTVLTAVAAPQPGVIAVEKSRGVGIGLGHPASEKVASRLRAGGVRVDLYPNADSMKWSKLITNLMANATAAICDLSTEAVYTHKGLYEIEVRQMREALQVMDALRLTMVALPRTPTRELAFALRWLPPSLFQPVIRRAVARGRGDKKPSFLQDLSAGKSRSEVGFLNGAVARHAEALGLSAPVNRALTDILESIVSGKVAWDEYRSQPDRLAKRILGGR